MLLHTLCRHAAKRATPIGAFYPTILLASHRPASRVARFRSYAIGSEMPGVELKVMDKLKEKHHAITTVESCTGGRIADLLTNVGGAAQVYWGSVITYDGSLKSDWGVPAGSIKEVGTVTEQASDYVAFARSLRCVSWCCVACIP